MITTETTCPNCGSVCNYSGNSIGESTMECTECGYTEECYYPSDTSDLKCTTNSNPYGSLHVIFKHTAYMHRDFHAQPLSSKKELSENVKLYMHMAESMTLKRYVDNQFISEVIYESTPDSNVQN